MFNPSKSRARLAVCVAVLVALTVIAPPFAGHSPVESATPSIVLVDFTAAERDAAQHTLGLFELAGLPLPRIEVRRHHDRVACDGFEGLHRRFGERSVIDICTDQSGAFEQRILLHELSHAWTEHYLGAAEKLAFQQLRGWTSWLDYKHAKWEDNGAEQAAEIITWGLDDEPTAVLKISHDSCTELHDGYVALIGREPLHGYTKLCERSTTSANRS